MSIKVLHRLHSFTPYLIVEFIVLLAPFNKDLPCVHIKDVESVLSTTTQTIILNRGLWGSLLARRWDLFGVTITAWLQPLIKAPPKIH